MTTVPIHIRFDERGVAWIDDTNVKVIEVALARLAHGWSPEEIHFQHPHLSLSQIHAALGFYFDNQESMDEEIRKSSVSAASAARSAVDSPIRKRLRELGRIE
jgi:uncharacterized protein (DUF433 family)